MSLKFFNIRIVLLAVLLLSMTTCTNEKSSDSINTTDQRRRTLEPEGVKFLMDAQTAFEQGAYNPALSFTDSVKKYDPNLADIYFLRGRIFTEMKRGDEAVASYEKVLSLDPNYQGVRHNLANLYIVKGETRRAIQLFKEEIEKFPASRSWLQMGRAYSTLNVVDSARISYEKAIELNPENSTAYMWMGQLYEDEGEIETALKYSKKGLELDEDNPNYMYIVGSELYRSGRSKEAITYLKKVIEKLPWHSGAHYNLGQAFIQLGRKEVGQKYLTIADSLQQEESDIEELRSMAEMQPDMLMRWVKLGDAYHKLGRLEEAMDAYKNALAIEPYNFALQNNIADLTVALGDTALGIQRYMSILKVNPNIPDVWLNLGVAYANSHRYQEARWAWNKALEQDPDYVTAQQYLKKLEELENN